MATERIPSSVHARNTKNIIMHMILILKTSRVSSIYVYHFKSTYFRDTFFAESEYFFDGAP